LLLQVARSLDRRPAKTKAMLPLEERRRRGEAYVDGAPLARSGRRGHNTTFKVARHLRNDLALPDEEGRPLMDDYNERLAQAGEETWTQKELNHEWDDARRDSADFPYGCAATATPLGPVSRRNESRKWSAAFGFKYRGWYDTLTWYNFLPTQKSRFRKTPLPLTSITCSRPFRP
jgi:hypothetical protein